MYSYKLIDQKIVLECDDSPEGQKTEFAIRSLPSAVVSSITGKIEIKQDNKDQDNVHMIADTGKNQLDMVCYGVIGIKGLYDNDSKQEIILDAENPKHWESCRIGGMSTKRLTIDVFNLLPPEAVQELSEKITKITFLKEKVKKDVDFTSKSSSPTHPTVLVMNQPVPAQDGAEVGSD